MLKTRINLQIRAAEVRVVNEDGEQLGVMKLSAALQLAQEHGLDLIEVAPQALPPVCKIIDFAKYKYQQKKAESLQKKHTRKTEVKTIWLSMTISQHDMEVKAKKIDGFLEEGDLVKIELRMRGREQAFGEIGRQQLQNFIKLISHSHKMGAPPKRMGGTWSVTITATK